LKFHERRYTRRFTFTAQSEKRREVSRKALYKYALPTFLFTPEKIGSTRVAESLLYRYDTRMYVMVYTVCVSGSEPPPSYDSIFSRVKAAKKDSTSKFGFVQAVLAILAGTGMLPVRDKNMDQRPS